MKNLRMSRRLDVNFRARFGNHGGTVKQISEGGMLFSSAAKLGADATGAVSLNVFDGEPPLSLAGRVVYELPHVKGEGVHLHQYGIRFTDMDGPQREAVAKVIRFVTKGKP
ncbi:MAG: PilZ domain-containing protein [Deltaproteobacteria bacterium]|nr:PilZ domain-containing protein [Deltaproteobacteria bacterium]